MCPLTGVHVCDRAVESKLGLEQKNPVFDCARLCAP